MERRKIGSLEVSLVGLGCNNFGWRTDAAGTRAISWLAMRPEVASVIAGAKTPDQMKANAAAANWSLNGAAMAAVDVILGAA